MPLGIGIGLSPVLLYGGGVDVRPRPARWKLTGLPATVPIVSAGVGTLRLTGKGVSPTIIPAPGTLAVAGKGVSPTIIPAPGTLTITGKAATSWNPLLLGDALIEWWDARTSDSLSLGGGNAISNVAGSKSVYNLPQATGSLQAIWDASGLIKFDAVDDYFTLTLSSVVAQGQMYFATPWGWFKSGIANWTVGAHRINSADVSQIVFVDAAVITSEQRTALETYLGATELWWAVKTVDTTIYNRIDNTTNIDYTLDYTGANAATYAKASSQAGETVDVGAQGLTAPINMRFPVGVGSDATITILDVHTNSFHGPFPSVADNVGLRTLSPTFNSISGVLPSFAANVELRTLACGSAYIGGNIPSLEANIYVQYFQPSSCLLKGYDGGGVSATLLYFDVSGNQLTESAVNLILADFVAAGGVSGSLLLNGGSNHAPTGQGLTDKATLQGLAWTVNTN